MTSGAWSSDGEEELAEAEQTGVEEYERTCQSLGLVPVGRWARALASGAHRCTLGHYGLGPRAAIAIGTSLQANACLVEIDLSDNRLGAEGVEIVASALLANTTVERLDLSKNAIGVDGACPALSCLLAHADGVRELSLAGNQLGDAGVRALLADVAAEGGMRVRCLSLADNKVSAEGARELVSALREATHAGCELRSLDLRWNLLGPAGASVLAEGLLITSEELERASAVSELDVSWNGLGDEGASAIAGALPWARALRSLALDNNNIGVDGARALADAVPLLSAGVAALYSLSLTSNRLGRAGLRMLAEALEHAPAHCPLRELAVERAGVVPDEPLYDRVEQALRQLEVRSRDEPPPAARVPLAPYVPPRLATNALAHPAAGANKKENKPLAKTKSGARARAVECSLLCADGICACARTLPPTRAMPRGVCQQAQAWPRRTRRSRTSRRCQRVAGASSSRPARRAGTQASGTTGGDRGDTL